MQVQHIHYDDYVAVDCLDDDGNYIGTLRVPNGEWRTVQVRLGLVARDALTGYIDGVVGTECSYGGDVVDGTVLRDVMDLAMSADKVKAQWFYGQMKPRESVPPVKERTYGPEELRLIHCALGLISEGGEILKAVATSAEGTSVREEIGDAAWYLAIGLDAMGDPHGVLRENLAKLRKRYPGGFDSGDALERKDKP